MGWNNSFNPFNLMTYFFFLVADFLVAVFFVAVFLVAAFLVDVFADVFFAAAFFENALGICSSIIFFTSSNGISASSSAVYLVLSFFAPSFSIFLLKRIKGPQRPFSIAIFSSGHCLI